MTIAVVDWGVDDLTDVQDRPSPEEVSAQLTRMLKNRWFLARGEPSKVWEFLVREEIAPTRRRVTQSVIGKALFPDTYRKDRSRVRTYVLRAKETSEKYYATDGKHDPIRIVLRSPRRKGEPPYPPGVAYRPLFYRKEVPSPVRRHASAIFQSA